VESGIDERATDERDELRERLVEAEQRLAELPSLRAARDELASVHSSLSWRLTAPLRHAAGSARREWVPRFRVTAKKALLRLARRLNG
jgi:hypothetical protein